MVLSTKGATKGIAHLCTDAASISRRWTLPPEMDVAPYPLGGCPNPLDITYAWNDADVLLAMITINAPK
jgi:hypothetical protein